jgi:hypothetical protein
MGWIHEESLLSRLSRIKVMNFREITEKITFILAFENISYENSEKITFN